MKKLLAAFLSIILAFAAFPITASAADKTELRLDESGLEYAYISWSSGSTLYDGTLIEKSADGSSWSTVSEYSTGEYEEYYVDVAPKTVTYFRVTCFTEEWVYEGDDYVNKRTYGEPSNIIEVTPKLNYFDSYSYADSKQTEINWSIDKEYRKYLDGFDVFAAYNGKSEALVKNVDVGKYDSKNSYSFNYSCKLKNVPEYAYILSYIVKPYFLLNGNKIYVNPNEERSKASYIDYDIATITTKRKKVTLKLKKIANSPAFIVRYRKYNLKTGKTYKAKKVTVKNRKLVLKTDTKKYGYYFELFAKWGKDSSNENYYDSHDSFVLMNSAAKSKNKTIKVINTRGKKSYTDWTYKLSASDKKTIKAFFKKKYNGNNPSKAQMAYDALDWINMKVKYDYEYKNGGLSYVDAIFNKKSGQCLQYNGAFAAVLTYLGYEARVIEGYRADSSGNPVINHFWCEVKLNGRWYLCEAGNNGKTPGWRYFVSLYRYSRGYTKNGKPAKD